MKSRQVVIASEFKGAPQPSNFRIDEVDLPAVKDGEVLVQNLFLSVDPYMRAYTQFLKVGNTMIGQGVAKVVESKCDAYKTGEIVLARCGWRTHAVVSDLTLLAKCPASYYPDISPSLYIGALGMPGLTAYYGLLDICKAKKGETVYVNSAAGAVGSVVGQIAKIKGMRVVGSAGTDEKVAWLKELGFDEAFNYKTAGPIGDVLKKYCPNGIDVFFENVGGEAFAPTLSLMNYYGRIGVCGAIAGYNDSQPLQAPLFHGQLISKSIKIEGFLVTTLMTRPEELKKALGEMIGWYKEGKLKTRENILDGFDKMPEAFMTMLKGGGHGKFLVKV
ncbi:Prostaglandin reductase 1 [Trichoplax sp. H2]|nr:Prostaglandin reductase 1 [Trichoplax sp. H2]|eukprot:RDD42115.1 Prostaglandin reductase 1 [Trichoplax sp. H2]